MNILILNWRDPGHPLAGGAEISLFEHAKFWKKKGANVLWFSSSFKGAKKNDEVDGIKLLRCGSQYTVHLWALIYFIKGEFRNFKYIIDSFHFIPFFSPIYFRNRKIIALINEPAKNAWFENIFFPLSVIGYFLEPFFFVFYKNKSFITGSNSIKNELVKSYSIPSNNITVIEHGVSIPHIKKIAKEKKLTLIFLSRLSSDKGIDDAIRSLVFLKKNVIDVQLWIVGKAESENYLNKLKKLVKDLKLEKNVKFYGFISETKKFELLSRAWILIHPSVREGWGINVIEANSMYTPAVGYNVVGLRDSIQDNISGVLVDPNPQSLATKILYLYAHKNVYNKLAKGAFLWSKNFSWEKASKKSYDLLIEKQ